MKYILKFFAIILIRFLQRKYKSITIKEKYNQTNVNIENLIFIQATLYYLKNQFSAWGYFHRSPIWTAKDEEYLNELFPQRNFESLDLVLRYNSNAITYYRNKLYDLNSKISDNQVRNYLIKTKQNN